MLGSTTGSGSTDPDPTTFAPAARQLADTRAENERLRELCAFLIDACAEHRIPVPINSSLLDLASDIASDGGAAAVGSVDTDRGQR